MIEVVFLAQIGIMLYSVLQPEASRITSAYVSLILNGIQIASMLIFSILLIIRVVYGICQENKKANSNKV